MSFYAELLRDRKEWQPARISDEPLPNPDNGIAETVEKVIALSLVLEMPVGAFIGECTRRELPLPKDAIALLKSNIKDETRHYRAFVLMEEQFPVSESVFKEASAIADFWEASDYHTLLKAKELETGVFLPCQGILRYFGTQSVDRMACDISLDEWRHVQTNWSVAEELGLDTPSMLNQFRKDTIDWVTSGLKDKVAPADFWNTASDEMVANGECPAMELLLTAVPQLSFFEIDNRHIGYYY